MRPFLALLESRLVRRLLVIAAIAIFLLQARSLLGLDANTPTYTDRLYSISDPRARCAELGWKPFQHDPARAHRRRRVYDLFMVNTELDWLEIRLNSTYDQVDYFVIVESPITFTTYDKPLYVKQAWDRFAPYHDKMIHHVVEFPAGFKPKTTWDTEDLVRDAMFTQVFDDDHQDGKIRSATPPHDGPRRLQKGDVLLVSDVDELVRPGVLDMLRQCAFPRRLTLWSHFYYYGYQFRVLGKGWPFPQATYFSGRKDTTIHPGHLRTGDGGGAGLKALVRELWEKRSLRNAGWHCSTCFDRLGTVLNKMASFSHTSMNHKEHRDKDRIVDRVRKGKDIWDRDDVQLEKVDVRDVPSFVGGNRERFRYLVDRDDQHAGFVDYDEV